MSSILADMTAPYGRMEAYLYDALVAPAVFSLRASLEDRLLPMLEQGARVLDVGCGGGQVAIDLARRRPDLEVVGVDLSAQQIARARKRAMETNVPATFVEGSALTLPFSDASFDHVISIASIKHWPNPAQGLRECVRVLRKGGRLLIVEADRGCRLGDARAFVDRWRIPRASRPIALALFRTWVAGQAIDLEEARSWLDSLPLTERETSRLDGLPAIVLLGRKS